MKTDAQALLRRAIGLLIDVPGWPQAPVGRRIRQALPILAPAIATIAIVGWRFMVQEPRIGEQRHQHQELLELEQEIAMLNLAYSEQQAEELVQAEAALRERLPRDARDAGEILKALENDAQRLGWSLTFRTSEPQLDLPPEQPFAFLVARARLTPLEANMAPLASLLNFLERIHTGRRRIDLMRLSISADESRWQAVELGLRLPIPISHAQASE